MTRPTLQTDRFRPACLDGRGYDPEIVETIVRERLLPEGLVRRLHAQFPDASKLGDVAPPLFTERETWTGLEGFREVCAVLAENGIRLGDVEERELFIDVYRFMATKHTLNAIDWSDFENDSMFQLVFPQPGMIKKDVVEAYLATDDRAEREAIAHKHMLHTNPHDGKQQLNKPWFVDDEGVEHVLHGAQHKYPQIPLVFDESTQNCFSFCTYCFRHAQVRGDEDMFVQHDVDVLLDYVRSKPDVTDLLITGGDAGFMTAERFAQYVTPLLEDPSLFHVKNVRLGTRVLTYEPGRVLSAQYEPMLELFDRLYEHGIQLAYMNHFSTPGELLNPLTLAAVRRLQAHHVVLRSQSPIMKHISLFTDESGGIDTERSARNWIDLGNLLGALGIGFHSMYCARPTGEHQYFTAPLAEVSKVFDEVYRSLSAINRPSRHLSMTTSAGKISIMGLTRIGDETLFALKFTEGRNMEWLDPVFLARHDRLTNNVALLTPYDRKTFFYENELRRIERDLEQTLAERSGS